MNKSDYFPTNNVGNLSQNRKDESTVRSNNYIPYNAYLHNYKPIADEYIYPNELKINSAGYIPPSLGNPPPYNTYRNRPLTSLSQKTTYGPPGNITRSYGTPSPPYMSRNTYPPPPVGTAYNPTPPPGYGLFNLPPDVTSLSNISDLFSTIDNRLVGEFGYKTFVYIYKPKGYSPSNSATMQGQNIR